MDDADLRAQLPSAYALALRLQDEGLEPEMIARRLSVEPEAVGSLLRIAIAKLEQLRRECPDENA